MPIRALSIFAILTFFCSVTYSSTTRPSDKLLLNGTAVHTSLQLDYYYAALFSESLSADESVANPHCHHFLSHQCSEQKAHCLLDMNL